MGYQIECRLVLADVGVQHCPPDVGLFGPTSDFDVRMDWALSGVNNGGFMKLLLQMKRALQLFFGKVL